MCSGSAWTRSSKVADLHPEEQEQRLFEECADDEEATLAIRRLLRGDRAAGDAFELSAEVHSATSRMENGDRIGDYVIEDCIGEGGSSIVYRARSQDASVDRKVAIKVLREALPSPEAVERFRRECLLLRRLEHQHIARLYHVGGTDGVPFLIMELVEGQDIATYCDQKRLTVAQRAQLMLHVCAAVEYAHAQLTVHRDLKPSNVLVDRQGNPKLVDFGIAKPLGSATIFTQSWTQAGVAMTPRYAGAQRGQRGAR